MPGVEDREPSRWIRRPLENRSGVHSREKGNYRYLYHALPKRGLATVMRDLIRWIPLFCNYLTMTYMEKNKCEATIPGTSGDAITMQSPCNITGTVVQ